MVPASKVDGRAAPADIDDGLGVVDRMVQRVDQVVLIGLQEIGCAAGGVRPPRKRTILRKRPRPHPDAARRRWWQSLPAAWRGGVRRVRAGQSAR